MERMGWSLMIKAIMLILEFLVLYLFQQVNFIFVLWYSTYSKVNKCKILFILFEMMPRFYHLSLLTAESLLSLLVLCLISFTAAQENIIHFGLKITYWCAKLKRSNSKWLPIRFQWRCFGTLPVSWDNMYISVSTLWSLVIFILKTK